MRLKWSCRGSARIADKHRGLDFHEITVIEESADLADDLRPLHEGVADLSVHDQIQISLAIADIRVLKSMELLRQRNQVLGQKRQFLRMDRDLPHLRTEYLSLHSDDITDIHLLEGFVGILSYAVTRDIDLYVSITVLNIAEGRLTHNSLAHHAAGDGDFTAVHLIKMLFDIRCMVGLIVCGYHKRIVTLSLKICQLLAADLQQLVHILLRLLLLCPVILPLRVLVLICHVVPFLTCNLLRPCRFPQLQPQTCRDLRKLCPYGLMPAMSIASPVPTIPYPLRLSAALP